MGNKYKNKNIVNKKPKTILEFFGGDLEHPQTLEDARKKMWNALLSLRVGYGIRLNEQTGRLETFKFNLNNWR